MAIGKNFAYILVRDLISLVNFIFEIRKTFSLIVGVSAVICTGLTIWQPAVNAFALMLLVIPAFALLYCELKQ